MSTVIHLPSSKSISNRLLVLSALAGGGRIGRLSDCEDVEVLRQNLTCRCSIHDVHDSGTALRFLTACLATRPGSWILTGSDRLCQRPVAPLADALRTLGASIRHLRQEGRAPLLIEGRRLKGGEVAIDASQSSQYASALLLIAPTLEQGLCLHLTGAAVSRPYIDLTLGLMRQWGAEVEPTTDGYRVLPQPYRPTDMTVEADWTAASYWMELNALHKADVQMPDLNPDSLQGDRLGLLHFDRCHELHNLSAWPDLVPTFVATCCGLGRPFCYEGVGTLRLKESDRLQALQAEMLKLGFLLHITQDTISWDGTRTRNLIAETASETFRLTAERTDTTPAPPAPLLSTHNDHRICMALAPLAARFVPAAGVRSLFDHPEVVSKSYPAFWSDFERGMTSTGH